MSIHRTKALGVAAGIALVVSSGGAVQAADSPAYPSLPKTVTCSASTNANKSVLKVKVAPRKGSKSYSFTVQKLTPTGWVSVKTYKTKGKSRSRTLNLKKGTYQVVCKGNGTYAGAVSATRTLRK